MPGPYCWRLRNGALERERHAVFKAPTNFSVHTWSPFHRLAYSFSFISEIVLEIGLSSFFVANIGNSISPYSW